MCYGPMVCVVQEIIVSEYQELSEFCGVLGEHEVLQESVDLCKGAWS